jgi:SAM-dependent methyltransferase
VTEDVDLAGAESPADKKERLRRGSSFGAVAAAYAEHRPDYAEAAVRWALEPAAARQRLSADPGRPPPQVPPLRVVDLGAGTGKLTATLVHLGAAVTAVEPDPRMLAALRRELPAVRSLPGGAEDIPLPDGCADAVLAGQAMHWFDLGRAMPEMARVLVPAGVVAGLWNIDDDRIGWVAELARIRQRGGDATLLGWRGGVGRSRREQLATAGGGLFGAVRSREFRHGQPRTAESLLATIATHSDPLAMDEPERTVLFAQIRDFLHARPETSVGEFVLPMITVVLRAIRK